MPTACRALCYEDEDGVLVFRRLLGIGGNGQQDKSGWGGERRHLREVIPELRMKENSRVDRKDELKLQRLP